SLNDSSPCRDTGFVNYSNISFQNLPLTDLAGNPRTSAEIIDIGAYEYYNPGIYLPQQDVDFGSVRHDRAATRELVIKNIGSVDLTNIEITFADTIAEYYTIDPDDIPAVIPPSPIDSVCIPIEFCCHKMFVHCDGLITITSSDTYIPEVQMMVYGRPALDNEWNWISFPALDRDASGNQDAEEVLEPLVPNANQLITIDGYMEYINGSWTHTYLDDIISTVGYKLEMFKNYDYYPFSMVGDSITLIPADTGIYLEDGYNWIGYWLPQSQNFDEAFGININPPNNHFDKVLSIQAENWYYRPDPDPPEKDFPGQSQIIPSSRIHPLHYGRGYIVEMSEPIYLVWNDPDGGNTKEGGYEETETFTYVEKSTYEVIDVIGLDETALEIGVLNTNDECLGAAKVDSLGSAQILAYTDTQTKAGTELVFCIYQGKGKVIMEMNDYLLYDFKTNEFIKSPLKAGIRKYNIVLFDSNNPQLLDKLILRQNFPNPFGNKMKSTSISFALPQKDKVMLKIYNIKGQLIKTVINNKEMDVGYYTVQWDGRNEENKKVCNGVYLYKIENSNYSIIKKMIILE
ncbi:MAG: T9SS type A sorting domain-containing protein, partial [Candidatus Cloacimonetes bacterium]|nr:T9SS type A sorting domain-containing protein [Candidatus Cloacimonadota bacterium]